MDNKYDIFISYRRLDEKGNISGRDQARLIAKQLELAHFRPFFDYSEIKDGEFDKLILPAIESCKIFILVLTKDSMNRCKNKNDWVRREIEKAIESKCKIINVSPDNSFNGWPDDLPDSIQKIKTIQISIIHFDSLFEMSMEKMLKERISPTVSSGECTSSLENTEGCFRKVCESLYYALTSVRHAFQIADLDEIINAMSELRQILCKVYSYSELCRYSNNEIANKAKNIVDQFNVFVKPYNKWIDSDRVSGNAHLFAKQAEKEFNKLIDFVVKILSQLHQSE
ncbi:MAG: toll/interleukin-1 receptor domain-containing protein [Bacteroidales bacterium]|nr:toll/interleukin-1 receptor domain-containing protein [Bacteroidales bacterium]